MSNLSTQAEIGIALLVLLFILCGLIIFKIWNIELRLTNIEGTVKDPTHPHNFSHPSSKINPNFNKEEQVKK